ncbi:uncharacterized protein YbjT (DUF2867 family) [Solirubrobacter pauli]|uniref:Uncharacterized protein YbjT (DUF2867 family) n=1 Tax=Solirubrobacter pauli TaxID=166793 RepID=A0A660L9Z4_9ACTN|nr:NAD(P)H-binding protein [Solirubrobacter pauli]RKQ90780.1 uncharacterized protein YbjT (DUF2867 family) [Solirubrobacter pauli]
MSTYLVIGGTGKTGRRVVDRLRADGHTARPVSRATGFDWTRPETYDAAVARVDGVFLTVAGQDPANAGRVADLLDRSERAGARRAVLLSARAVEFHPTGALAAVEAATQAAPLAHTILRPSWFAQNFTEAFLSPDAEGRVTAPAGDGREPFVDLEDVAAVAVAALLDGHDGTLELSGSEALTFGEAVTVLGERTGRPVRFEPADPLAYRAALAEQLPPEYVDWRMAMFDAIRTGRDARLSDGIDVVLGRPATSFSAWAEREVTFAAAGSAR